MVDRVVLNLWNHAGSLPDIRAFRDSAVIVFGGSRSTACARNLRVA